MTTNPLIFPNPFRPGAGHIPPHLAGRKEEEAEFRRLLQQPVVMENMILTGLRGVGKTVLLERFKSIAFKEGWMWVGTDLSESASISETTLAQRVLADLAPTTSTIATGPKKQLSFGFSQGTPNDVDTLGYDKLVKRYEDTPGLVADKLKSVFSYVAPYVKKTGKHGIVFAYDEAQNMSDHADKDQFPLSVLLEIFQSVQRQEVPFLLLLVGLPTLFPKLVEARTYAERMFRVIFLRALSPNESMEAINKPVENANCPVKFSPESIQLIIERSGGYPYFIQFMCRETFDAWMQKISERRAPSVPINEIVRKLDSDFFAGRWSQVTDRHQHLLYVIANLETADAEFTVQEIVNKSKEMLTAPFGRSRVHQILDTLIENGLVFRDRHGKYLFAVPLMADFIKRTMAESKSFATAQQRPS